MLVLLLNSEKRTLNNMKPKHGLSFLKEKKMDASTHTPLRTVCQASTVYIHTSIKALVIEHDFKVPINNFFSGYFPIKQ